MTKIYRQYDAEELEREYMPANWPNVNVRETVKKWDRLADDFYARTNVLSDVAYGDSNRERLDLFLPPAGPAPILVFIHGGYWRSPDLTKRNYSFCLEPIVAAGALVATVEYDLCPDVSMDTIVGQVRNACAWIWQNAGSHGGDPARLHVTGHSAGGHLAAMMAATDWTSYRDDIPGDLIKSIIPVSALSELEPFRLNSLNGSLHLDEASAARNSPCNLRPSRTMPISVIVGGGETDEFRRQSRDLADTWRKLADPMAYIETGGHDHFQVVESMIEPRSVLTATILRHLGI